MCDAMVVDVDCMFFALVRFCTSYFEDKRNRVLKGENWRALFTGCGGSLEVLYRRRIYKVHKCDEGCE